MRDTKITKDLYANLNQQKIDVIFPLVTNKPNKYQLIYASQLYGTFFCVFSKLKIVKGNLVSMDLHLVNYKGPINLGLLKETENGWSQSMGIGYNLELSIKAADGSNSYNGRKQITVPCGGVPVNSIAQILVMRKLNPLYKSASTSQQLEKEIFDSEFYDRDGEFVYRKPTTDEVAKAYYGQNPSMQTGRTCNEMLLTIV